MTGVPEELPVKNAEVQDPTIQLPAQPDKAVASDVELQGSMGELQGQSEKLQVTKLAGSTGKSKGITQLYDELIAKKKSHDTITPPPARTKSADNVGAGQQVNVENTKLFRSNSGGNRRLGMFTPPQFDLGFDDDAPPHCSQQHIASEIPHIARSGLSHHKQLPSIGLKFGMNPWPLIHWLW